MESLSRQTFTTSRDLSYTYYKRSGPAKNETPERSILLLHGFPDSAHLWQKVVPYLHHDFTLIIPDLLGYGGSSKPTDPALYNSRDMAKDLHELLKHEHVHKTVVLGHDWGSFLAQRFYLWHPESVEGLGMLNVAFMAPAKLDFHQALQLSEKMTGYPRGAYWELFTASDGADVLGKHLDSFWTALHGDKEDLMLQLFCVRGALRDYVEKDTKLPLRHFAQPGRGWREQWMENFRTAGFAGPLCWYQAMKDNQHWKVEQDIPHKRWQPVAVPSFYLACTKDAVCLPQMIDASVQKGYFDKHGLKISSLDSAHWCTMEKPDEVGVELASWLKLLYPSTGEHDDSAGNATS